MTRPENRPSLPEVHRSIKIPNSNSFWRKMFAYAGPGYLVSVGYMDPGNWATDIAGGSKFGYTLLTVILLSNLMAILLQSLCVRLGVATGRDLAQACRDYFNPKVSFCLWILCEIAIAACDLAELLGETVQQGKVGDFAKTREARQAERFQWALAPAVFLLAVSLALEVPTLPGRRRVAMGTTTLGEPLLPPLVRKTTKLVSTEPRKKVRA